MRIRWRLAVIQFLEAIGANREEKGNGQFAEGRASFLLQEHARPGIPWSSPPGNRGGGVVFPLFVGAAPDPPSIPGVPAGA
jgi:hypothetical protein